MEQLLAKGEAEYVELQALFDKAHNVDTNVTDTNQSKGLDRTNSDTVLNLATEAANAAMSTSGQDLSVLAIKSKIEKLLTLRRKAYELRAHDDDDYFDYDSSHQSTKGKDYELQRQQYSPHELVERSEKRLHILTYISTGKCHAQVPLVLCLLFLLGVV